MGKLLMAAAVVVLALVLRRYVVARRARPAFFADTKNHLDDLVTAVSHLDELIHRYPQWREDVVLVEHLYPLEQVGTQIAGCLLKMVFGPPLKALDRLDVLTGLFIEGVHEFESLAAART